MLLLRYRWQSLLFLILTAYYLSQVLLKKPNEAALERYGISAGEAQILALTIAIPYVLIWLVALVGHLRLKSYADIIVRNNNNRDGRAFHLISWGLFFFVLWLPFNTIVSNEATKLAESHQDLAQTLIILRNYASLILLAPAFILTYLGSRKLTEIAKTSIRTPSQRLVIVYLIFAAVYTYFVFHDPGRQHAVAPAPYATYYLPDWLILTTLVIPRLVLWYLGIHAAQNILLYRHKIKGSLYKIALKKLAIGVATIVISVIVLRSFQSFSSHLASLSLAGILIVIYLLLALISLGYIWVYQGAGKLLYIEKLK